MKSVRIGNRMISISGVSESDPYYSGITDGMEDEFARFCQHYLRDDDIALDVGANIGITATILSQRLAQGHIHAFEPAKTVYSSLARNIADNKLGNVTPHNLALSDKPGQVNFVDASAYGHITTDKGAQEIRAATVDEMVASLGLKKVDFIKIDVEGFEEAVLKGAKNTIEKFRPLIYLEFNSWCLIAYGRNNPVSFAEWIMSEFQIVNLVSKEPGAAIMLQRLEKNAALGFVHENILRHGCVNDLVVTNDEARLKKSAAVLAIELEHAIQERDQAILSRSQLAAELERVTQQRDEERVKSSKPSNRLFTR